MKFEIDINKDGEHIKVEARQIKQSAYDKDMVTIFMTCNLAFDVLTSRIEAITKIGR